MDLPKLPPPAVVQAGLACRNAVPVSQSASDISLLQLISTVYPLKQMLVESKTTVLPGLATAEKIRCGMLHENIIGAFLSPKI